MSQTATGTFTATSTTTFEATFTVKDAVKKYTGSFKPPMSTFSSKKVELKYDSPGQLLGQPAFSGEIGITRLSITLSSGVTFTGDLDTAIPAVITIYGEGSWA
ncbi:hypothetical protein BD779DRAFT_1497630 [Infundibulicybe gibba]|nr:hypothetical protein BD779DRAFT_1497630 [Infundibulicybe gibba]